MRFGKLALVAVSLVVLSAWAAPRSHAQTAALEYNSSGSASSGLSSVVGYAFTVNTAILVTDLGANFNPALQTPGTSSQVGLWNSAGTLLVNTTVVNTDPKVGHFNYHAVTNTLLTPGSYTVGGLYAPSTAFDIGASGFTTPAQITYVDGRYLVSTTLQMPTTNNSFLPTPGNFGGTFRFITPAAVPEPGSVAFLVSLSVTGAGFLFRRRKQVHTAA